MVEIIVDGKKLEAAPNTYLLKVLKENGIRVPTLCDHEALEPWGGCRLCLVEITKKEWQGWSKLVTACLYPVEEGLIVSTKSKDVMETRKQLLDLLLARCPNTPLVQELAKEYGIDKTSYVASPRPNDCVLCGLCTRICEHLGMSAIALMDRGIGRVVAPPARTAPLDCIGCLSCAYICPTAYIKFTETDTTRMIWHKEFEMLQCSVCGKAYITKAQAEYFAKKQNVPLEYFSTCDACKREHYVKKFGELFG